MAARSKQGDVSERILQEATRLFAEQGFDGTSIQSVADSVGVSKPSLLYHFHSKEQLRLAVLDKMVAHWNEALPRLLVTAATEGGQADAVFREMVRFMSRDPYSARLLVRELLDRGSALLPMLEQHMKPWVAITADYIRRGQQQGTVHRDLDPEPFIKEMIILFVGSVAAAHCSAALSPVADNGEDPEIRFAELLRVATASLLVRRQHSSRAPSRDGSGEG